MKAGLLISFLLWGALLALFVLVSGCSTATSFVPTLKYCDDVQYKRLGEDVELRAKCRVPAGKGML